MIAIFGTDGERIAMAYNGLTFNSISSVESVKTGIAITAVSQSSAADFISEKLQWRDGIDVSAVTRSSRIIVMNGYVYGSSNADLYDRVEALSEAFDPGRIAFDNTDPFLPLTFSVPTTDTANFPTGLAASKVFAMPTEVPIPTVAQSGNGLSARFRLTLLAKDPRRYLQTPVTLSNAGTLSVPAGAYPSYPTLTFTMSGAGHAAFTIQNVSTVQGTKSLVLDLSGRSNTQAITVDFAKRQVLVNGTNTAGIFVSGTWFLAEYGSNAITYSNTTNVGTRTLTVYPAFSL